MPDYVHIHIALMCKRRKKNQHRKKLNCVDVPYIWTSWTMTVLNRTVIGWECMSLRHISLVFFLPTLTHNLMELKCLTSMMSLSFFLFFYDIFQHTLFFCFLGFHVQNRSLHHCRSSFRVTAWFWFFVFRVEVKFISYLINLCIFLFEK